MGSHCAQDCTLLLQGKNFPMPRGAPHRSMAFPHCYGAWLSRFTFSVNPTTAEGTLKLAPKQRVPRGCYGTKARQRHGDPTRFALLEKGTVHHA